MATDYQKTLARPLSLSGHGVHSGRECAVTLVPAPVGYGVRFIRADLPGTPEIPVCPSSISEEPLLRQTILCHPQDKSVSVRTVEHILAVLHGLGIDNARVEMTGPEAPIWDGGAGELARRVAACGTRRQEAAERRTFRIGKPVSFAPEDTPGVEYTAWPSETLTVTYFLEYNHPVIGSQAVSFRVEPDVFAAEIAPARTFCTSAEVEYLRSRGLVKGGQTGNAIVVGDEGILNTRLRWPDEMARHKLLDLLGDLLLIGAPVRGHVLAYRGGHHANAQFIRFLGKEFPQA
jgi:UDP-3-O-[3-hydroxymyristoyl] N-acetylglucosamine deacetylase